MAEEGDPQINRELPASSSELLLSFKLLQVSEEAATACSKVKQLSWSCIMLLWAASPLFLKPRTLSIQDVREVTR